MELRAGAIPEGMILLFFSGGVFGVDIGKATYAAAPMQRKRRKGIGRAVEGRALSTV